MSLLIPTSEDENYEILSGEVGIQKLKKYYLTLLKIQRRDEEVPERGDFNGKEDVPFSTVPENSDKRFYHENYIAKEMGTDRTHANRCTNTLRESGNFLSTNLFEKFENNGKYYRISDEKIADSIIDAIEGCFFNLSEEENQVIRDIAEEEYFLGLFMETRDSKHYLKYVEDQNRIVYFGLVKYLLKIMRKKDPDSESFQKLLSRLEETDDEIHFPKRELLSNS